MEKIENNWDFLKSNTKEYTHCFHAYPAMMIPQIARRLLEKYGKEASLLFDPYCGSGTSLVEANLNNIISIGTDLNPLARIIAKSKTTPLDLDFLDKLLNDFYNFLYQLNFSEIAIDEDIIPSFDNIDFWFSKNAQKKLAIIKKFIRNIEDESYRNFFIVAFSETVRESSFTKKGEFKLIRIPSTKRENFSINPFDIIISKLERNKKGLIDFINAKTNGSYSKIYDFNTVDNIPTHIIGKGTVDLVITSPPYGDSRTTVAYGQYSRLSSQWLDIKEASLVDKKLMGGTNSEIPDKFSSQILNQVLEEIEKIDIKRKNEVASFFNDYKKSIDNISQVLKKQGKVCYVVGNRTVKGIVIPLDRITNDFFESNGFEHVETIVRNIPNKRMPSLNSPTNVIGRKSNTMKNEYIVICRKK
jgi:DNA modification methylase